MAWTDHLQLVRLDQGVAVLSPTPGHRELVNFIDESRQQMLAREFSQLLGQPLRVVVQMPRGAADEVESDAPDAAPTGRADRRAALDLPLVKDVFDIFPDASLIDVRPDEDEVD